MDQNIEQNIQLNVLSQPNPTGGPLATNEGTTEFRRSAPRPHFVGLAQPPEYCRNQNNQKIQTNKRYKNFRQSIYTAGDIEQFDSSRIRQSLIEKDFPADEMKHNIFENDTVIPFIWNKHKNLDSRSVSNTFKYIFYKLKKGIFIRIANNELQTFLPFTNAHYKNEFGDRIKVNPRWRGNVQSFLDYVSKKSGRPYTQTHVPFDEWVANNALLRFEIQRNEGDNNVLTLYDMFKTLCSKRIVPDIEFFINRRDFPQLKNNDTEPYNHIFDSKNFSLLSHNYNKYAPILSGSTSHDFADIAFPTYEDWARAVYQETGNVFPNSCREYPKIESIDWNSKIRKAVFRGATTGAGVTSETNQRLKALDLSMNRPDLLNVGITSWNFRPRKYEGDPYLRTIERQTYPKADKLSLQNQSDYKYILTLEGHVAAYRLSYELSTKSVILLANSKWKMWYYKFLKPYVHYIPVSEDLSDLGQQIQWCENNDLKCEKIALNAKIFYDLFLGTKGILDFLQKELWELSDAIGSYNYFPDLLLWSIEDERQQLKKIITYNDTQYKFNLSSGVRCVGRLDGMLKVFQSKTINDLEWKRLLLENVNGQIYLYRTNNFWLVGKKANNDAKTLEHIHESYIGLKAINSIVGKVPNFAYIYGLIKNNNLTPHSEMVFVEYIDGENLMKWLQSPQYNYKHFLNILVQINLALAVSQNYIGFVHYDLYPWNIVIQYLNKKIKFDYFINSDTVLTFETDIIPVIIDYGKSRAVVFEEDYGLIDHGFANLFKSNSIIDTLTLLYGSINVLNDAKKLNKKINIEEILSLTEFGKEIELNNHRDSKHHGKYGSLFDFTNPTNAKPLNFINFLVDKYPDIAESLKRTIKDEFSYKTEIGNPIQTSSQMFSGDENAALLEVIMHIDKHRPPTSTDEFFQSIIKNILFRRLKWIESEINSKGNPFTKQKWSTVNRMFEYQPKIITHKPFIDYPKPTSVWLDSEITSNYIANQTSSNKRVKIDENWSQIWIMCVEAYLFGQVYNTGKFGEFIEMDGFLYQNAIASNNTLLKIKKLLA